MTTKTKTTFSIKNVIQFKDHDGYYITQGSVYADGKRIGSYSEDAWGGSMMVDVDNRYLSELSAIGHAVYVKEMGGEPTHKGELVDWAIGDLVEKWSAEKERKRIVSAMKRAAKKHTLFLLDDETAENGGWRYLKNIPRCDRTVNYLKGKFPGDRNLRVYNDATGDFESV
jgi:hypothetical protein